MVHLFADRDACRDSETFAFTFMAGGGGGGANNPSPRFCFDGPLTLPLPTHRRPLKRPRALSDVDGQGGCERKKRRLRLQFITSRLSRPFSAPATNIVNRGRCKLARWGAKQRSLGAAVLRKAAIMNSVRVRMDAVKDFMRQEQERRQGEMYSWRQLGPPPPRRKSYDLPLPPSPLGLSNYDALDLEDDLAGEGSEDGLDKIASIYSDFNIMTPDTAESREDNFGYLDALDGITPRYLPDTPRLPLPRDDIVDVLRENMHGQSYFMSVAD